MTDTPIQYLEEQFDRQGGRDPGGNSVLTAPTVPDTIEYPDIRVEAYFDELNLLEDIDLEALRAQVTGFMRRLLNLPLMDWTLGLSESPSLSGRRTCSTRKEAEAVAKQYAAAFDGSSYRWMDAWRMGGQRHPGRFYINICDDDICEDDDALFDVYLVVLVSRKAR
jgi:hypothetical protein